MKIPPNGHGPHKTPEAQKGNISRECSSARDVVDSSLRPLIDTFSKREQKFLTGIKKYAPGTAKRVDVRRGGGKPDDATGALTKTDKYARALFKGKAAILGFPKKTGR